MNKNVICLGIETSCDETSVAIVDSNKNILSHIVYSQIPEHQKYGGVVPELAARSHILTIDKVTKQAIQQASISLKNIDIISATAGPGLIGGVMIGWFFAKGLGLSLNKPVIAINHLEGHALVPRLRPTDANGSLLTANLEFPYLLMLASGGHCQILVVKDVGNYELLGQTLDDSAGEVFDKVAKMLGLSYPGGPIIDKLSKLGDKNKYKLPRPLCNFDNCDFSFSGIKSSARNIILKQSLLTDDFINDMCASLQEAISSCIINKITKAINKNKTIKTLVVAGGVAKNSDIRNKLENLAQKNNMLFIAPSLNLCTDNGAMIAWAGIENNNRGRFTKDDFIPRPRWSLTEL